MRRHLMGRATVAALLAAFHAGALHAGDYELRVGAEMTRGDYGTEETSTVWTLPVQWSYASDRLAWKISVPWVVVDAPQDFVVSGGGGHGAGGGGGGTRVSDTRTEAGLGDVTASLSLPLQQEGAYRPWLGVTGEVKFATGDETRGLGTGAEDYAMQLETAMGLFNGRVGHRWLGDSDVVQLDNVFYGAVGIGGPVGQGNLGIEWYGEESAQEGVAGREEVTLYGGYALSARKRLAAYVFRGLSEASADLGAGFSVGFAL